MPTVSDILNFIDTVAPFSTQCEWDNSGLLIGDANKQVHRVGFVLDLTSRTLQTAIDAQIDLLVTHHPVIFRPRKNLLAGDPLYEIVRRGIAVICVHTPWDCADYGVNDVMCFYLHLKDVQKIATPDTPTPMLRIGTLEQEMTPQEFAAFAAKRMHSTVRLASCGKNVKTVAVCGGAAMELCEAAREAGADLFFTGDAKHHELLDAVESGISVVAAGHYETERPTVTGLKNFVAEHFEDLLCVRLEEPNPVEFFSENR